jgi:hypothetical protein
VSAPATPPDAFAAAVSDAAAADAAVREGTAVGIIVVVGTRVTVFVGPVVGVFVGIAVAVFVGTAVAVFVGTAVAVFVGRAVAVFVGRAVGVFVGTNVAVLVGAGVALPALVVDVAPMPPMLSAVVVASALAVLFGHDVALADGDALACGIADADGDGAMRVGDDDGGVGVGDGVGDGVNDGVGDGVSVGVGDGVSVDDAADDARADGNSVAAVCVIVAVGVLVIVAQGAAPASTGPQATSAVASYCPRTVMPRKTITVFVRSCVPSHRRVCCVVASAAAFTGANVATAVPYDAAPVRPSALMVAS